MDFMVQDVQVIGEFTAPNGIFASNYFLSLKLRGREHPIDIPVDAEGLFQVLLEMRKILPGLLMPALQMSEGFASNVLYPAHVAGMEMYRFERVNKPLIDLPLLRGVGSVEKIDKLLNPEVLAAAN